MSDHIADANKMVDTPRMNSVAGHARGIVDAAIFAEGMKLERELNAANESFRKLNIHALDLAARIKRLEEALDLVIPNCSWVHHSKKHQHKCGEPCPVVALIEKSKEDNL